MLELIVLLLSIIGLCPYSFSSESSVVRFVYVPENLLEMIGVVIKLSGKATDGF